MPKHKMSQQRHPRAKRGRWSAKHQPRNTHTKRRVRYGQAAGYYSATMHVWLPTNARRHSLQTGGYEGTANISG